MKSNQFANISLIRTAELCFSQIQHIGIFGLDLNLNKNILTGEFLARIQLFRLYFQLLEEQSGLAFEENEVPLLYTTLNWPNNSPPAGYSGHKDLIKPSTLLESYLSAWNFYFLSKEEKFWGGRRFLKAALWVFREDGITASIKYLFDLQRYGFALGSQDIYDALNLLIKAQRIVGRDEDILKFFFDDHVPDTYSTLIGAEFCNFDTDKPFIRTISIEVVQALISAALEQVERVRKTQEFDTWLAGQWILRSIISQVQHCIENHVENISISLQAILDQLEEMRADAGGIKRLFETKVYDSGITNFNPLLSDFIFGSNVFGAIIGVMSARKEDPKTRLFQDRCLIPYALQPLFEDSLIPVLPNEWKMFSQNLAPIFSHIVLGHDFIPEFTRLHKFSQEEILNSEASQNILDDRNIQDPLMRRVLAMLCVGEWKKYSIKRLAWELHQLTAGDTSDSVEEDIEDELDDVREAVNQWLEINKLAVKNIIKELRVAVSTEEIKACMDEVFSVNEVNNSAVRTSLLEKILEKYPWWSAAYQELAITLDMKSQTQRALEYAETSIIINPLLSTYWQSLAVILRRLGSPDEARIAGSMSAILGKYGADRFFK